MTKKTDRKTKNDTSPAPVSPGKKTLTVTTPKISRKYLKIAGIVAVALCFGALLWQYNEARADLKKQKNPQIAIQEEGEDTQAEVSKVMVLPVNETPTVASISDIAKLKEQPFFVNAQNGDKVLIYKEARKAIIYRPSTKQIVEVATYNSGQEPATQAN